MPRRTKGPRFPELVLRVYFEDPKGPEGFCHVNAWVDRRDGRLMCIDDPDGLYRGVHVRSQSDWDHLVSHEKPMYGHDVEWKDSQTNAHLRSLQWGVRALGEIDRKMDAMYREAGDAASFGAWVQRLATAIGVGGVSVGTDRNSIWSPQSAAGQIDWRISQWQEQAKKRAGLSVA